MSEDMPCILASGVWWSRSKRGSVVAERILDSSSRQWSQSFLGTFRFSIFLVDSHFNSRILPSHKFIQGECGSILFLWHPASRSLRAKSPRFCSLEPSIIISGGTPSCLNRLSREKGVSLFFVMGMVQDQTYDVANTWANLCPRCNALPASNVSVNKGWGNLLYLSMRSLVGNILMIEGFVTCHTPRCVVARTVVLALSSGMFHLFASVGASTILR